MRLEQGQALSNGALVGAPRHKTPKYLKDRAVNLARVAGPMHRDPISTLTKMSRGKTICGALTAVRSAGGAIQSPHFSPKFGFWASATSSWAWERLWPAQPTPVVCVHSA